MRIFWTLACLIAALAGPARAENDTGLRPLTSLNESRAWEAVGLIDLGGEGFCTGSLIAEDLVLTAAHCLFRKDGSPFPAEQIKFLAGFRNGRAAAYRGVRIAVAHPAFSMADEGSFRIAHDLGLLKLDQPVRLHLVSPFALEHQPRKGASVAVVSYAWDRSEAPSLQQTCHVLDGDSGILVMTCDIDFGSSGSPVFLIVNGTPRIVSVISSKAEIDGRKVSLGTDLEQPLAELKSVLAQADGVFVRPPAVARRLTPDAARATGGAKFVRP